MKLIKGSFKLFKVEFKIFLLYSAKFFIRYIDYDK